MIVKRTERIWLKPDEKLSHLCHISKNLYNQSNYIVKQTLDEEHKWVRYYELYKQLKDTENYKELGSLLAQQTIKAVDKAWKGFFTVLKDWKAHPEKYLEKPSAPKYKRKSGEFMLKFTYWVVKLVDGKIVLPKKYELPVVKTRLGEDIKLKEVRILPQGVGYWLEIVYEKDIIPPVRDFQNIVGVDLGVRNIVTIGNNIGETPIIIRDDGTGIKSTNQYFSKKNAELRSVYAKQNIKTGKKLAALIAKHGRKTQDYLHKLSKSIVNWCVKHNIGTLVIGYNDKWKQSVELGKRTNQMFVQLPFAELINKLAYKLTEAGVELIKQEESHSSKCSFLDNEPVEHREKYLGKRVKRGLFEASSGILINADVNGAYNIIKKAKPGAFNAKGVGGCGLHPVRLEHFLSQSNKGFYHV